MKFRERLKRGGILLLDGAMGTMLQKKGMPVGMAPERFCLENPSLLRSIHEQYLAAGSDIITTCTFGANPFKLPGDLDVSAYNREMARVARAACDASGKEAFVAGNLGPTGTFVRPLGEIEPRALIDGYARQVAGLVSGGVDLIFIETQFDLAEARLAVVAAREVTDLPVMVSMTFENGVCLTGSSPEIFVDTMCNLSCDVVGTNCSLGPEQMEDVVSRMLRVADVPVMAEPNAGLPRLEGNETVFPLEPVPFAEKTARFADLGCTILGGCCGTQPEHIAELARRVRAREVSPPRKEPFRGIVLTSRTQRVPVGQDAPFVLIGERINPTGKKALTQEFQEGRSALAMRYADQQIQAGADVLDCNVGAPLVDEERFLPELLSLLIARVQTPLSIDSSSVQAILNALPLCPGSFLVNSISGEQDRMERLAPQCRKYGAPFILLPLQGSSLPVEARDRIRILEGLLQKAEDLGIPRRLILVDILALTVSSTPEGALTCLAMLDYCRRNGLPTTLGLSNISFGLPARPLINASFLCMACGAGLSSAIANPEVPRLQEDLACIRVLQTTDQHAEQFIARYASYTAAGSGTAGDGRTQAASSGTPQTLRDCVICGDKENVLHYVEQELQSGTDPFALVQETLIPAITEVGHRYEIREYFLPQLIRSAETMQTAFDRLKPLLEQSRGSGERPCIVMATVEGDIHDIGKNIVCLLLSNHGFDVVDMGKDVPAEKIVDCAVEHRAALIGLSALMTTTMVKMEETIRLVKERHLDIRVLVGGAAVTRSFADKIGADAYCADAVQAVEQAKALLA